MLRSHNARSNRTHAFEKVPLFQVISGQNIIPNALGDIKKFLENWRRAIMFL